MMKTPGNQVESGTVPPSLGAQEMPEQAAIRTTDPNERIAIPWDLGEWVERPQLLRWIVEGIDALAWENPEMQAHLQAHPEYQPRMLLQLMTYAYATGVFCAEDVAEMFYRDPAVRALGWDRPPKVKTISQFRQENRGLFKWTLVQVLQRSFRTRFDLQDRLLAGLKRYLVCNAVERLDLARHLDRSAAEN